VNRNEELYSVDTDKSVTQFVRDFGKVAKKYDFVVNNSDTMNMKNTFREHGAAVEDDFDLHMMHVCKPVKSAKSLSVNYERAIFMPKFVMVFSKDGRTQIRYLSFNSADIATMVPDDPKYPESLALTYSKIRSMIDEAR